MKAAFNLLTRHWPPVALLVAAAMLATAHIFENLGYAPCTLCLRQREVYWTAGVIAALTLAFTRTRGGAKVAWAFDALLAATFLYGAGLAFYHSGVEWKWWPGPESCAATGATASAEALDALLRGAEIKPPACDEPNWWFLGLTMANWNTLVSLGLAGLGGLAAIRRRRP
jgi:disulfide bond formation protein DsbB